MLVNANMPKQAITAVIRAHAFVSLNVKRSRILSFVFNADSASIFSSRTGVNFARICCVFGARNAATDNEIIHRNILKKF